MPSALLGQLLSPGFSSCFAEGKMDGESIEVLLPAAQEQMLRALGVRGRSQNPDGLTRTSSKAFNGM